MEHLTAAVECRASESGPALHATILTEGAAASGGRAEVFRVGSATWPHDGVAVRLEHHGAAVARAVPTRDQATGEIRISVPANDVLRTAVDRGGKHHASIEFHALEDRVTAGGVRDVSAALITGFVLTDVPEYDTTRAEVRTRRDQARQAAAWL